MRDGHVDHVTDLNALQPGRKVRANTGANHARLVSADGVVGQRGAILIGVDDLTVRHKTKLDQRLEAVTDTCHQTVTVVQQIADLLLDCRIAEEGGNELTRAVGLVAARKAAGQEDDLGLAAKLCKLLNRAFNALTRQIIDDKYLSLGTRIGKCLCAVIFTVCTREDGNNHLRLSRQNCGSLCSTATLVGNRGKCAVLVLDIAGINAFQLVFIGFQQCVQANFAVAASDLGLCRGVTQQHAVNLCAVGKLQNKAAVVVTKDGFKGNAVCKRKADAITQTHLEHALGNAAQRGRPCGQHLAALHAVVYHVEKCLDALGCGQTVLAYLGSQQDNLVTRALEFAALDLGGVTRGDREGHQRGRNVQRIKRTAHGVLTADRSDLKVLLCHQRA